ASRNRTRASLVAGAGGWNRSPLQRRGADRELERPLAADARVAARSRENGTRLNRIEEARQRARMARWRAPDRLGRAPHDHRHHADESRAARPGTRSWLRRNPFTARSMGQAALVADGVELAGVR